MRRWSSVLVLLSAGFACAAEPIQLLDHSFLDFSRGTVGAGGQNIYVARNGSVRTINRFDINSDGYNDLIFNCTHDTYQMLPATIGRIQGTELRSSNLSVEGSQQAAHGDLDRDGYTDVVICPNAIGVHHDRRFLSIAWGSRRGWSPQRITSALPINGATRVEIADLNRDGWLDIGVLGGRRWLATQQPGRIVRVFWGSKQGYAADVKTDISLSGAIDIAAGHFNNDAFLDLAVLRSGGQITGLLSSAKDFPQRVDWKTQVPPTGSRIFSGKIGDPQGSNIVVAHTDAHLSLIKLSAPARPTIQTIQAAAATHVAIGDLDHDGHTDLALTRFLSARAAGGEQAGAGKDARDGVLILWGSRTGFKRDRSSRISAPAAVATAIGDLNGDGKNDLTVAVHQGKHTFNGTSHVWLGRGQRKFQRAKQGFRTSGTTDVVFVSREKQLPPRVVFCNSIGGRFDERVPVHVYWGGKGGFDKRKIWKIPFQSGYEASCADLNADGYPDLMLMNSGHAHAASVLQSTLGANIFWGGPNGFDLENRRTVIHEHFLGSSSIADLDRDGYLDVVLEPFAPEKPGKVDELIIYYGPISANKKSILPTRRQRVTRIAKPGYSQEHLVADLNRDQWLDIAHTSRQTHDVRVLWGSKQGFSAKRATRWKFTGGLGLSAADLNQDGWLDLYGSTYADPREGYRDLGSTIFWGSRKGFRPSNAQWLPGFSPLGRSIADLDGDGWLDIFSPQHSGELTREDLACHIYWNSKTGFRTRNRTTLFCDSVNDSLIGDFNQDGRLDLAVACHTQHGNHRVFSRVFYNDGQRFRQAKMIKLPTNGTHLMWAADIGNIYTRKYRETFRSRVHSWNRSATSGRLKYDAKQPKGSRLQFRVRSAATRQSLIKAKWRVVAGQAFALGKTDRFLQYHVSFHSPNGDRYATLRRVELTLK